MKNHKNFFLCLVAALGLGAGSGVNASIIGQTGTGAGLNQAGVGYTRSGTNGGEFRITNFSMDLSGYGPSGPNGSSLGADSFETFCLETDEYTAPVVSYTVSGRAVGGGSNVPNLPNPLATSGDRLSVGTAWLYSNFARQDWSGSTAGYTYTAGTARENDARELQMAIWFLEGENNQGQYGVWGNLNKYVAAAMTANPGTYQNDNPDGGLGVYVLNTYVGNDWKQSQLYYNPNGERVPDGGSTIMLLGAALGGISVLRRYLKA